VIVYCRDHGNAAAIVERNPVRGFVELRWREPRFRNHHAKALGIDGRHNAWFRLEETTRPTVNVNGCRECGEREIEVVTLLTAFDLGRSTISV